ncbi:MAG: hypothetical protein DRJ01_18570, partial [Bacteroidetes bacterium]
MIANTRKVKKSFLKKQSILENAREILKTEFIGINKIIDEVIDNVSSWFFLSDIQEKPVVINLWGLTGVGKTSLVNRLVELIDFEDSFYRFDLGEKEGSFSFRDSLDDLCENNDISPVIIALDEIQHSRTVTGPFRQEVKNDENRMIWELIDSGKIQHIGWKIGLWSFEDTIRKLIYLIKAGVIVRNGVVVKNTELYCKEMGVDFEKDEKVLFFPKNEYGSILDFSGKHLGLYLLQDVEKILLSYSAKDTIMFLNKVLKIGKRPSVKNFTKALIFVLGNLDEAYTMSDNLSADIDADEFHKLSRKITIPQIKKALQNRFRNEQIARLGNIHIIYPALDKKSYKKIIQNELNKFKISLSEKFDLKIEFSNSVNEIIYNEGVYPTQGVRPIFTSIHQVLKSKISLFLSEIFLNSIDTDKLYFSIDENVLKCIYLKNKRQVYEKQVEIITTLGDARKNKKDDMQAITAVHESGHAVLSAVLLKTIPDVVYSVTSDAENQGFVYSSLAWKYISRKELIPRVAMMLGGYVAEELIFGKENLTSGAGSDIEKATEFLSKMFKSSGMGSLPISYGIPTQENNDVYHNFEHVENEIKRTIEDAKQLAEFTLKKEKVLLLELSDYLSDNRMLLKNDISSIIENKTSEKIDIIENGEHLFYRKHLKQQIK